MHYKIDIPKPCHENWQEMTPTEKGRFCANCEKEVFDFSGLSKYEITQKIKHNKNLCGRFQENQLNQEYVVFNQTSFSRLGIVFGIGSLLALVQPLQAQTEKSETHVINQQTQGSSEEKSKQLPSDSLITISGTVHDIDGFPLPAANVLLKGTSTSTQVDFDGNFSLEIPAITEENPSILVFSNIGAETQEIEINKPKNQNLTLQLNVDESCVTTGIVVVAKQKTNIFQRFLNVFRKKENRR